MKTLEILTRLQKMDQLIRLKATGKPNEFARRIGISQSMLYNYLNLLKSLGASIHYSRSRNSYEYEHSVKFQLGVLRE